MANRGISQHKRIAMGEEMKRGGYVVPRPSSPITKLKRATPPVQRSRGGHEKGESAAHERREEKCK